MRRDADSIAKRILRELLNLNETKFIVLSPTATLKLYADVIISFQTDIKKKGRKNERKKRGKSQS